MEGKCQRFSIMINHVNTFSTELGQLLQELDLLRQKQGFFFLEDGKSRLRAQ